MKERKHAAKPDMDVADTAAANKKKNMRRTILLAIGSFLLVLVLGFVGIFWYFFGGLQTHELQDHDLGIDSSYHSSLAQGKNITNIALFGIDTREGGNANHGLSDAIIILSINHDTNKVKLISVMRDSYVKINGKYDKITHAYGYGGAALAVKTLNENFKLNITDYVTVNFQQLARVIDAVGGIRLDVTEAERNYINSHINEVHGSPSDYLQTSGPDTLLNGIQAVGFSRIRKLDSDQARTSRQREVIMAVFDQVMTKSVFQYPGLVKTMLPMVTTSFTYSDVLDFLPVATSGQVQMAETMIPGKYDNAKDAMINGVYYMQYDLTKATNHIHDFIYNDIDPNTEPEN